MFKPAVTTSLLIIALLLPTSSFSAPKPFTVMLDWQLNPDHAALWVGQHYGFFANQGLDVKLIPPADSADPPRFAAAGKVDVALTYEPQWIIQQQQHLPLAWVATLVNQPLAVLLTQSSIKTPAELRGKTIGYDNGAVDSIFLTTLLKHAQLTLQDVKRINVHYAGNQALVAGKVDATSGNMRNVEPIELKEKGFRFNSFYPEDYGVPSYAELIFVTKTTRQNEPEMQAFVKGLTQSIAYLKKNPQIAWQAFAKDNPALDDETNHAIWQASIAYFDDTPGVFDAKQYEKLKRYLMVNQNSSHPSF